MAVVNSVKQPNDIWATAQNSIDLDLLVHTVPHIFNSSLGLIQCHIFLYDNEVTVAHINCFINNALLSSTNLQVHTCLILENFIVRSISELKLIVQSALITQRLVLADIGIVLRQLQALRF